MVRVCLQHIHSLEVFSVSTKSYRHAFPMGTNRGGGGIAV